MRFSCTRKLDAGSEKSERLGVFRVLDADAWKHALPLDSAVGQTFGFGGCQPQNEGSRIRIRSSVETVAYPLQIEWEQAFRLCPSGTGNYAKCLETLTIR